MKQQGLEKFQREEQRSLRLAYRLRNICLYLSICLPQINLIRQERKDLAYCLVALKFTAILNKTQGSKLLYPSLLIILGFN